MATFLNSFNKADSMYKVTLVGCRVSRAVLFLFSGMTGPSLAGAGERLNPLGLSAYQAYHIPPFGGISEAVGSAVCERRAPWSTIAEYPLSAFIGRVTICDAMAGGKKKTMLTTREAAKRLNAAESSIRIWARRGRFPGAYVVQPAADFPGVPYWLIPESALASFEKQKPGPKAKTNPKSRRRPSTTK